MLSNDGSGSKIHCDYQKIPPKWRKSSLINNNFNAVRWKLIIFLFLDRFDQLTGQIFVAICAAVLEQSNSKAKRCLISEEGFGEVKAAKSLIFFDKIKAS